MSAQATIEPAAERVPIRSTALFATVCRSCNCHLMRRKQQAKKAICELCKTELEKQRKKDYYLQNQEAIKSKQRVRGKLATRKKQQARLIAQPEPFTVTCKCGATLTRIKHPGKAYSNRFTCSKCKHQRKLTWQRSNRETWSDEKRNSYLEGRKAKDRKYYQEHKEICKHHSRKSERRSITEIRPSYVKKMFKREGLTEIPTVLIEVRQKLIEIKRIIKNENNAPNP